MFLASPPFSSKHVTFVPNSCDQPKLKYVTSNQKGTWEPFLNLMQPENSSHVKQVKGPQPHTWGKHLQELTSLCCKWFDCKIDDQALRSNAGSPQLGMWEWWQISSLFGSSWISHLNIEPPQRRTKLLTWRLPRVTWCTFIRARSRRCDWCKTRTLHFSLTRTARAAFCFHLTLPTHGDMRLIAGDGRVKKSRPPVIGNVPYQSRTAR